MKKTFLFLFISIILLTGCIQQDQQGWGCNNKDESCNNCKLKGGVIMPHSFSSNCEFRAKDAGMACIYNDECSKNMCLYSYPKGSSSQGFCADFSTEEGRHCTRERGQQVECVFEIS